MTTVTKCEGNAKKKVEKTDEKEHAKRNKYKFQRERKKQLGRPAGEERLPADPAKQSPNAGGRISLGVEKSVMGKRNKGKLPRETNLP